MEIVVQNSYSRVVGATDSVVQEVLKQVLTYKNDISAEKGQLFYQLKLAKRYNNQKQYHATMGRLKHLEATEYVCLYQNDTFPTGLLNIVLEALRALKCQFSIQDQRESPGSSAILRWNNPPPEPRYYQKDMIKLGLNSGRGVFVSAVGTGKSLVLAYLVKEIAVTSLIVVPSRGLSGQLYNDFASWFGGQNVDLLDAQKIRKIKRPKSINIVTVQSLASLKKTGEFKKFAEHIDAIYCDEIHHAGASSYTNLLEDLDHVYYRFGFTGTFLRNDSKTLEMWSFLSNVLYQYPAHKAIEEGYLTPMEAHIYGMAGKQNIKYQQEYDNCYSANPELLAKVREIIECADSGSQILILVNKKDKVGKIIHEYLNTMNLINSYISGDNSRDEINNTIQAFNEKKVNILIGSSVIGEGIDVRSTDHLIMCQGGKSEVTIVQAVGRAIRLFQGKKKAYVHDFRFQGTNYMEGHVDDRIDIYQRNFQCDVYEH